MQIDYNASKFRELLLYVADKSAEDPHFGAVKLNKVLFFSDFLAYATLGRPITGATYRKLPRGPAPRQLLRVQSELVEQNAAVIQQRQRLGLRQIRLIPLREPDLSIFTASEIALVDQIITAIWEETAHSASDLSHRLSVGWNLADDDEEIPYSSVFLSPELPPPAAFRLGDELASKYSW